jgi:hypothetical protein
MRFRTKRQSKKLLQDAKQVGGRIAEESLVSARRQTARGLENAAALLDVDERPARKRRRKPLLIAALAGLAGWVALKARKAGPQVDEAAERTTEAADRAAEATKRTAERTKQVAGTKQPVKSGNAASR